MPLLHPDVIKLDMAFVQQPMSRERARVVHAVAAEAERSGALVLAEGIENAEQAAAGQDAGGDARSGLVFRPPRRAVPAPRQRRDRPHPDQRRHRAVILRLSICSVTALLASATKAQLLQMSLALEEQALLQGESAVLLSTFQEARYFPPSTRARYTDWRECRLCRRAGSRPRSRAGCRGPGSALESQDSLRGEWDVVVLGPHFAGAFVARDLGDDGPRQRTPL